MSDYYAVIVAPLIPLACLALVLWLDHLEETLDREAVDTRAGSLPTWTAANRAPASPAANSAAAPTAARSAFSQPMAEVGLAD